MELEDLDWPEYLVGVYISKGARRTMNMEQGESLHDRPVLDSGVVSEAEDTPDYNVLLKNIVIPVRSIRYTLDLCDGLQGIPTTGIKLIVLVSSDPEVALSELGPFGLCGFGISEKQLRHWREDLVSNRLATDRVEFVEILHLESSFREGVGVKSS